jgi:1-acyl-sn-glycerol-3-phosphate acyltransferase
MPLTDLGIPNLWNEAPEVLWHPAQWLAASAIFTVLAPGSRGYGLDRVPLSGGFVVAANHLASLDHPLIGINSPRTIRYMAKAELMAMPLVGELLKSVGAFPVRRGEADRDALREARRLVREGHVVGVHVEGTRQRLGYPGEPKIGGMMIAMQEGVPVVPCAVETFRWSLKNRRPCSMVWGEPIETSGLSRNRTGYDELMSVVQREIVRLWRLAAEAVVERFPPELSDGSTRFRPFLYPFFTDGRVPRPG